MQKKCLNYLRQGQDKQCQIPGVKFEVAVLENQFSKNQEIRKTNNNKVKPRKKGKTVIIRRNNKKNREKHK